MKRRGMNYAGLWDRCRPGKWTLLPMLRVVGDISSSDRVEIVYTYATCPPARPSNFQQADQILRVNCEQQRILAFDGPRPNQVRQRFFHGGRAFSLGHRDFLMQVLQRIAPDVLAGTIADHQEFRGWNPTPSLVG